jgi:hypothetical protein
MGGFLNFWNVKKSYFCEWSKYFPKNKPIHKVEKVAEVQNADWSIPTCGVLARTYCSLPGTGCKS